ncbi:alpha/beta fold hydrolase [Streptomyces sp. TRM 70361]|uniref:thioesterase II family protein n=1 Tax=Streptomyces sp. TRM 70361 TaxID=3116553 RepID=UPI002E7BC99F|nr:alpha/beta fold hydrolase [Streptomyces sp. TRM 70361]MEE1943113.1 alpha/beta fold hydrolase [Streptomyces sp. TRM 70361]
MATSSDAGDLWVRRFHPAPQALVRLLCLPHAGGSASYFYPVSQRLAPRVETLAVQYPGRQDRRNEPCLETVQDLADQIVEVLGPWQDKPLALFGHSLGATVAFEVALRMEARGTRPAALIASGRRAPSAPRDERVHLRNDEGLLEEIRRLDGTQSQLLEDDEIRRMVLPSIRADYKAAETYRYEPGPPLSTPLYALTGDADPKATTDEVRTWADHTTGRFEMTVYPGGHFYLNAHAPAVTEEIAAWLVPAATAGR